MVWIPLALLLAGALVKATAEEESNFILQGLPYAFDALEPEIDKQTMEMHWGRHHRAYTDNMNAALHKLKSNTLVSKRLRDAVQKAVTSKSDDLLEDTVRIAMEEEQGQEEEIKPVLRSLRNNGGGYLNHNQYWSSLAPASLGGGVVDIKSLLDTQLTLQFGSFEQFQNEFIKQGMSVFGSGWVFLTLNTKTRALEIVTTPNQDRPSPDLHTVLLACDVWEHAYYLKRQNRRLEYLNAFFSRIDMSQANARYVEAKDKCQE